MNNSTLHNIRPDHINFGLIRVLIFLLVTGICIFQLILTYRGLDQQEVMDQAQIARNVAQGKGFSTNFLRPIDIMENSKLNKGNVIDVENFRDSNHAPLNICAMALALKLTRYDNFDAHRMDSSRTNIYMADRIISACSTFFFLLALILAYILTARLFDEIIACTTITLMGLSDLLLQYAASGLALPLTLCCTLLALNFLISASKAQEQMSLRKTILFIVLSFAAIGLACLSNWMMLWCAFGLLIFCALYFQPRGLFALIGLGILSAIVVLPLMSSTESAGGMMEKFFLNMHGCFGTGSDAEAVMRSSSLSNVPFNSSGFFLRLLGYTLAQFNTLYINMGAIIVTPFFFLALFNRYKNPAAQAVKWATFAMWLPAAIGMALFGETKALSGSQLNPLFTAVFCAFGLALLFNFLARLNVGEYFKPLRNLCVFVVILISSGMFLFSLPKTLLLGIWTSDKGIPKFPPYYPPALNGDLADASNEQQVIMTDQPWAVAWYANRKALWMPKTLNELNIDLEPLLERSGSSLQGILITPSSHSMHANGMAGIIRECGDFAPLVMEGKLLQLEPKHNLPFADLFMENKEGVLNNKSLGELASSRGRFNDRKFLWGAEIVYYTRAARRLDASPF